MDKKQKFAWILAILTQLILFAPFWMPDQLLYITHSDNTVYRTWFHVYGYTVVIAMQVCFIQCLYYMWLHIIHYVSK